MKKLVPYHAYKGVNKCGNFHATSNWIAKNIKADVKANPNIKAKKIARLIEHKYQLDITYNKAWRGRE